MNESIIYVRLQNVIIEKENAIAIFYNPNGGNVISINLSNQAKDEGISISAKEIAENVTQYAKQKSNMKLVKCEFEYRLKKFAHILKK